MRLKMGRWMQKKATGGSSFFRPGEELPPGRKEFVNRAGEFVQQMSLAEKVGQMTLASIEALKSSDGVGPGEMDKVGELNLGGLLAEGNSTVGNPANPSSVNSRAEWRLQMSNFQKQSAEIKKLGLIIGRENGTDAIRGDQHTRGAVLEPHNLTLSATKNPQLAGQLAAMTAKAAFKSGFSNVYGPQVDMIPDGKDGGRYDWGRTYEAHAHDPEWVREFSYNYVKAMLQAGVMPTIKHWPGPRGDMDASDDGVDEGFIQIVDMDAYMQANSAGYEGGFAAANELDEFVTLMVSYHSINGKPASMMGRDFFDKYLPKDKFQGYIMSDYSSVEKAVQKETQDGCYLIATTMKPELYFEMHKTTLRGQNTVILYRNELYYANFVRNSLTPLDTERVQEAEALKKIIGSNEPEVYQEADKQAIALIRKLAFKQALADTVNTGIDMLMIGPNWCGQYGTVGEFQTILMEAVEEGLIPESRIDEAVTRILSTKLARNMVLTKGLALEEKRELEAKTAEDYDRDKHQALALKAAEQSLVVLKHSQAELTKPIIPSDVTNLVFLGAPAMVYRDFQGKEDYPQPVNTGIYAYNNIGRLLGGWNERWQGREGNEGYDPSTKSISGAFENSKYKLFFPCEIDKQAQTEQFEKLLAEMRKNPDLASKTMAVAVLAEPPYAEFVGDRGNGPGVGGALYSDCLPVNPSAPRHKANNLIMGYDEKTLGIIKELKTLGVKITTIVASGRPVILNHMRDRSPDDLSDTIVYAGLPGTEGGQAIRNALTGKYTLGNQYTNTGELVSESNTLTVSWVGLKEDMRDTFDKNAVVQSDDLQVAYPINHRINVPEVVARAAATEATDTEPVATTTTTTTAGTM